MESIPIAIKGIVLRVVAFFLLLLGAITLPLPLPTGVILLFVGTAILITTSETAASLFKSLRKKFPRINTALALVQGRLPNAFQKALQDTDPNT